MPRVSVVVPVYNAGEYLAEALDSILAQSFDDLEVVVVDDGSTDGSRGIIESYGSRVRAVFQENAGPSAARNAGIRTARGSLIAFCDADDLQLPHRIATHIRILDEHPEVALVGGDLSELVDGTIAERRALHRLWIGPRRYTLERELVHAFGQWRTCAEMDLPVPTADRHRRVFVGAAAPLIALVHLCWGNASLFRKSAIEEVGGFDRTVRQYEDWHLVARIALRHPIAFVDAPVMNYRRHEEQISKHRGAAPIGYLRVIDDVWKKQPDFYAENKIVIDRAAGAAHYQVGTAAAAAGRWVEARDAFLRSLRAYPKQRRVFVDLAKATLKSVQNA